MDEKILDLMAKMNTNLQDVMKHLTQMSNKMYVLNKNTINSNKASDKAKNETLDGFKTPMLETKLLVAQMAVKIDDMHAEQRSIDENIKRREKDANLFKEGVKEEIDEIRLELSELRKAQRRESKHNRSFMRDGK